MGVGRPRGFDLDEAVQQAMQVFWTQGYDNTSIADLTQAMGINAPSLYAAFGSKEGLFKAVLDRYSAKCLSHLDDALRAPTARETVKRLLAFASQLYVEDHEQRGCLLLQANLNCAQRSLADELMRRRGRFESVLRERFEKAVQAGDLPPSTDLCSLARYIVSVLTGMGVQAVAGASQADLEAIAAVALMAFPEAPKSEQAEPALASTEHGS